MKKTILAGLLLLCAALAGALELAGGVSLRLEGDSTMHRYCSTATAVSVTVQADGSSAAAAGFDAWLRGGGVKALTVEVPVTGLKSGKAGLDKNMYSALKAKEHPAIRFALSGYEVAADPAGIRIKASGRLSIAGVDKNITLEGFGKTVANSIVVHGNAKLKMTDFGISPPTMFLGALRTDDKVVVYFDLELRRGQ